MLFRSIQWTESDGLETRFIQPDFSHVNYWTWMYTSLYVLIYLGNSLHKIKRHPNKLFVHQTYALSIKPRKYKKSTHKRTVWWSSTWKSNTWDFEFTRCRWQTNAESAQWNDRNMTSDSRKLHVTNNTVKLFQFSCSLNSAVLHVKVFQRLFLHFRTTMTRIIPAILISSFHLTRKRIAKYM